MQRAGQTLMKKKAEDDRLVEREKERQAEAQKTARLRELRLAKEAVDREAAAKQPPASGRKARP